MIFIGPVLTIVVYEETINIHAGDAVTFVVRTAGTIPSGETWDFGDGTAPVSVRSDASTGSGSPEYAETVHAFAKPGVTTSSARSTQPRKGLWLRRDCMCSSSKLSDSNRRRLR